MAIFGAGGDLTKRLIMPALYNLVKAGKLPDEFAIIGVDHNDRTTQEWRQNLTETMHASPDNELLESVCNENEKDVKHMPGK